MIIQTSQYKSLLTYKLSFEMRLKSRKNYTFSLRIVIVQNGQRFPKVSTYFKFPADESRNICSLNVVGCGCN